MPIDAPGIQTSFIVDREIEVQQEAVNPNDGSDIDDTALIEFMEQYETGQLSASLNQELLESLEDSSLDSELINFMNNFETSLVENDLIMFMEIFEANGE